MSCAVININSGGGDFWKLDGTNTGSGHVLGTSDNSDFDISSGSGTITINSILDASSSRVTINGPLDIRAANAIGFYDSSFSKVLLSAPSIMPGDYSLTWPAEQAAGTDYVLKNDGDGVLYWEQNPWIFDTDFVFQTATTKPVLVGVATSSNTEAMLQVQMESGANTIQVWKNTSGTDISWIDNNGSMNAIQSIILNGGTMVWFNSDNSFSVRAAASSLLSESYTFSWPTVNIPGAGYTFVSDGSGGLNWAPLSGAWADGGDYLYPASNERVVIGGGSDDTVNNLQVSGGSSLLGPVTLGPGQSLTITAADSSGYVAFTAPSTMGAGGYSLVFPDGVGTGGLLYSNNTGVMSVIGTYGSSGSTSIASAGGAGTAVFSDSAFDGSVGSTQYTLNDIVAMLKNANIAAL